MSENATTMLQTAPQDNSLSGLLKRPEYARRFEAVLGERAAQFSSSLISIGNTMKDVEPKSIIGSAMIAAALDLPIDKNLGFAWIVPYKKDGKKMAQFQMGYKGYIQLAQRTSQYSRMNATTINQEVFQGYDAVGEPNLDWEKYDPAKPVWGYFFGFQLTNGFTKKAVWTKEKLLEHAKRYSQSFRSGADIWREQLDGMGTKTVISNTLRKWGPLSVQLQRALQADTAIVADLDAAPVYPEIEDAQPSGPVFEHPAKVQQEAEQKQAAAAEPEKRGPGRPKKNEGTFQGAIQAPPPEQMQAAQNPPVAVAQPEPAAAPVAQPPAETDPTLAMPGLELPLEEPPVGLKVMTELQKQLMEHVELTFKHTLEEFTGWAGKAIPYYKDPAHPPPKDWSEIPDDKCRFFITNIKGVDAGIKNWKLKKQ